MGRSQSPGSCAAASTTVSLSAWTLLAQAPGLKPRVCAAFAVESLEETEQTLQALGVTYNKFVVPGTQGGAQLFLHDPEGNGASGVLALWLWQARVAG